MKYLASIIVLVLIGCAVAVAFQWRDDASTEKGSRTTRFGQTLAEGVNIRKHGYYGIDFIKCSACRIEKRKLGPLTLGGFNVLVLEDLSLVLPNADGDGTSSLPVGSRVPRDREGVTAKDIVSNLGISDRFIQMRGGDLKFSGLKLTNFELATLDAATNVCPRFIAASGEAKRDGLHLAGCVITEGGVSNRVGNAVLKTDPNLHLIWAGGELKI